MDAVTDFRLSFQGRPSPFFVVFTGGDAGAFPRVVPKSLFVWVFPDEDLAGALVTVVVVGAIGCATGRSDVGGSQMGG